MELLSFLFLPLVASAFTSETLPILKEVTYPAVHTAISCENEDLQVSCLPGNVIHVVNALYGRQYSNVCRHHSDTDCLAIGALEKIRNECEGKTSCKLTPTNSVFGDPCQGVPKYIKMVYKCVLLKRYHEQIAIVCEHKRSIDVSCPEGQKMLVTYGYYGRHVDYTCPGNVYDTMCYAPGSKEMIVNMCHNKHSCSLTASNSIFGDPCKNTTKYLALEYYCVKNDEDLTLKESVLCEGESEQIVKCPKGKVILLADGFYGRDDSETCPGNALSTKCKAGGSEGILKDMCNNQQQCRLTASNSVFGDPCHDTYKFIRMKYYCLSPQL